MFKIMCKHRSCSVIRDVFIMKLTGRTAAIKLVKYIEWFKFFVLTSGDVLKVLLPEVIRLDDVTPLAAHRRQTAVDVQSVVLRRRTSRDGDVDNDLCEELYRKRRDLKLILCIHHTTHAQLLQVMLCNCTEETHVLAYLSWCVIVVLIVLNQVSNQFNQVSNQFNQVSNQFNQVSNQFNQVSNQFN